MVIKSIELWLTNVFTSTRCLVHSKHSINFCHHWCCTCHFLYNSTAINNSTDRDDSNDLKRYFAKQEQFKKRSTAAHNPISISLLTNHLFNRKNDELSGNNTVKTDNDN